VRDAIIGESTEISDATISHSLVGDDVTIEGESLHNMVAARDEIGAAP
jgi:hypothetical protein